MPRSECVCETEGEALRSRHRAEFASLVQFIVAYATRVGERARAQTGGGARASPELGGARELSAPHHSTPACALSAPHAALRRCTRYAKGRHNADPRPRTVLWPRAAKVWAAVNTQRHGEHQEQHCCHD